MTPAVDSRHAGATMSDRDFAKLQMQRDAPGTHSTIKRRLTAQINAETERRKSSVPKTETAATGRKALFNQPVHPTAQDQFGHLMRETDQEYRARPDLYRKERVAVADVQPGQDDDGAEFGNEDEHGGPLVVRYPGGKLVMIDGHHRAAASKSGYLNAWVVDAGKV